jgi:hypothetical protein
LKSIYWSNTGREHLAPILIVFTLTGLEIGVVILQAYVFIILIYIYLNDAKNFHYRTSGKNTSGKNTKPVATLLLYF